MKPHALVIGGAGRWGALLSKALSDLGWPTLSVDDLSSGDQTQLRFGPLLKAHVRETSRIERAANEYGAVHIFLCCLKSEGSAIETAEAHFSAVMSMLAVAKIPSVQSLTVFSGSPATDLMIERILSDCQKITGKNYRLIALSEDQKALEAALQGVKTVY